MAETMMSVLQLVSLLQAQIGNLDAETISKIMAIVQAQWPRVIATVQVEWERRADWELRRAKLEAEEQRLKAEAEHQKKIQQIEAQRESAGEWVRSVVLFLVILAIVMTPLVAMLGLRVPPSSFSEYIAPITGIAGTVLGYWFGRQEPPK